ncbi:hypothetical protein BGZ47_002645, partial [Haplosporangium gracile]
DNLPDPLAEREASSSSSTCTLLPRLKRKQATTGIGRDLNNVETRDKGVQSGEPFVDTEEVESDVPTAHSGGHAGEDTEQNVEDGSQYITESEPGHSSSESPTSAPRDLHSTNMIFPENVDSSAESSTRLTKSASSFDSGVVGQNSRQSTCISDPEAVIPDVAPSKKFGKPTGVTGKPKKHVHTTDEPWRSLAFALMDIVNEKSLVSFPDLVPGMIHEHAVLLDHAVTSLKQYQDQDVKGKKIELVKDAQVAMSCVFNTMLERACRHFEEFQEKELVETAKLSSIIEGFDQHECSAILKKYAPILAENSVQKFMGKLISDLGSIFDKYSDPERLPTNVELENKVLEILIIICKLILRSTFGKVSPSESDCLHVWMSVFSVMVDQLTIHSGEKILESLKIIRQQQSSEFGEVSEGGRKVDMLFMFNEVEISNVEFKRPGATERELAIQNRKNIRLARCIQEAHAVLGIADPSVLMTDIVGFVGVIYQVKSLRDIAIAGETAYATVCLPQTRATLMAFLEGNSLAMMWNFILHLEAQGQSVSDTKDLHKLALEKEKLRKANPGRDQLSQVKVQKRFQDSIFLTPSKKRVKIQVIADIEDASELSPPSSSSTSNS